MAARMSAGHRSPPRWLRSCLRRGVFLALLWWVFSGGEPHSWVIGAPAVVVGVVLGWSLTGASTWELSVGGLLRFAGFFVRQSFLGGLDVAFRALHPKLPLKPELVQYRLSLPEEAHRVLLANTASLLPGSLSAQLEDSTLTLHVLDASVLDDLPALERRVAQLFAVTLPVEKQ
jgi:multicomponent Na+:H+ antiporter subunit E